MFGYVVPKKDQLRQQDYVLYRSFYCGLCKSIGRHFGQLPRFATTYDVTFLSVLVFDQLGADVTFAEERCVGNPVQRHVIVTDNGLLRRLAAASVILSYHKLNDDIVDGRKKGLKLLRRTVTKAYHKAVTVCPGIDKAVADGYEWLRTMERAGEGNIDRVADAFACVLRDVAAQLTDNHSEMLMQLCYNLGKFVYLVDALDDVDEDFVSGNYNPLLRRFPGYQNRRQFIDDNFDNLNFIFASTVNRAIMCFNELDFTQSYTLLKNVVHLGLRAKVDELLQSVKKLERPNI